MKNKVHFIDVYTLISGQIEALTAIRGEELCYHHRSCELTTLKPGISQMESCYSLLAKIYDDCADDVTENSPHNCLPIKGELKVIFDKTSYRMSECCTRF
jgi:hypothetical protein